MGGEAIGQRVMIVGGGLAGGLMACYLGRAGYEVDVFERGPDPRIEGFSGGRSINLALSTRGITALREVDLADVVLADAVPMSGRMLHDVQGHTRFQRYSTRESDAIKSVSRGGLNIALLEAADGLDNVTLHFGARCVHVNPNGPNATFSETSGHGRIDQSADFIIGADGAFSAVRGRLMKADRFNYTQAYLEHGYKELTIPAIDGAEGQDCFAMNPHALHIWPRGGSMMIALPNADGTFTCTLFWPFTGEHGFDALTDEHAIVPFFERHYRDAVPLMPTLTRDYQANPIGSLVTVRCSPWTHEDKVVLIGDAAHAIVPFYGQGMNAGFEDCRILAGLLGDHPHDRLAAFSRFNKSRQVNANAIADMALANFIEMRDHTASASFLMGKKLEHGLHRALPFWFTPLYNMVSFSNIPYAKAHAKARRQARTLRRLAITIPILLVAAIVAGIWWLLNRP